MAVTILLYTENWEGEKRVKDNDGTMNNDEENNLIYSMLLVSYHTVSVSSTEKDQILNKNNQHEAKSHFELFSG